MNLEQQEQELAEIVATIKSWQKIRKRKANNIAQKKWQAKKKASLQSTNDNFNDKL